MTVNHHERTLIIARAVAYSEVERMLHYNVLYYQMRTDGIATWVKKEIDGFHSSIEFDPMHQNAVY